MAALEDWVGLRPTPTLVVAALAAHRDQPEAGRDNELDFDLD